MLNRVFALFVCAALLVPAPLTARESLGIFAGWGAFRDPSVPRCYAIATPQASTRKRDYKPFASIGTWPRRSIRGQVHFRLSRKLAPDARVSLLVGGKSFRLTGGGGDAWAQDAKMDAAIVAAMRSAPRMSVRGVAAGGIRFTDRYDLDGAATAMDAAIIGCAPARRR